MENLIKIMTNQNYNDIITDENWIREVKNEARFIRQNIHEN